MLAERLSLKGKRPAADEPRAPGAPEAADAGAVEAAIAAAAAGADIAAAAAEPPGASGDDPADTPASERARLAGRDIICFANDWSGDPLSKKHIMRRLAARNRVLWVNSIGNRAPRATTRDLRRIVTKLGQFAGQLAGGIERVEDQLWVLSPLAVPNYHAGWARAVNELVIGATVRRALRALGFRRPLLYTFVPASAWVARRLGERHVVYHCVDEYAEFAGAGPEIAALEAELIGKSDLVITCSTPLCDRKSRLHPRTVLVRHGVEHSHFARALDPATEVSPLVRDLPRPVFGFYGLVAEWVDLEAMRRVALAYPHGSMVVVGEHNHADAAALERLRALPNVHVFGRQPYSALPGLCKGFDLALLPFIKNELTENANPLKLREYLAAGLSVVATDIPEAVALAERGVYLADSADAFVTRVGEALLAGAGPSRDRSAAMARESWDEKVAEIEQHLLELGP